jgi:hypothetical protein
VIGNALDFISKELVARTDLTATDISMNSARKLTDGSQPLGAFISLINIQEESTLKNTPHTERRLGELRYVEPPVHVNLYLLFAFDFSSYDTSLTHLSKTIEHFQTKRWFGAATQIETGAPAFPASLEKLVFEMVSLNFEELNNLWGVLGGTYLPSVVYKVRLVRIQKQQESEAPEITTVQIETAML